MLRIKKLGVDCANHRLKEVSKTSCRYRSSTGRIWELGNHKEWRIDGVADIKGLDISKLQGAWSQIHICLQAFCTFQCGF